MYSELHHHDGPFSRQSACVCNDCKLFPKKRYFHETCSQICLAKESVGLIAIVVLHIIIWHDSVLSKSSFGDRRTVIILV